MKPFILLVLCCSFYCSRANPLPFEFSDCDDPDVFKAVDAALQKYNGDRTTGNQFALYVVMEAKRTAGPDPQFYVKYRILETSCAIEENKRWQQCHYKPSAEAQTGECTARVHMNDAEKTSNISQDCKISSATLKKEETFVQHCPDESAETSIGLKQDVSKIRITHVPCLGCYHVISADSSQVSEILEKAIQKFNKYSDEPALFKLVEIKQAKRQVVVGWNYIIEYEIEETNCSKEEFSDLTPECRTTSKGHVGKCEAKAYQNLQAEITDIKPECKFQVRPAICPGCPQTVSRTSPELQELLEVSMEKYNSESNYDFHYKHGEVQSATVQVVAGKNYEVKFRAWKTNCSKSEFEKLNEDCKATSDSVSLSCEAQIYVVPWENKTIPKIKCSEELTVGFFARRPPGFTPFRSAAPSDTAEDSQSPGKEIKQDAGQEPEGKDRPESLQPRCPGKPWKQIMDLPDAPSFPREFTDEDLLPPAAENVDSATANEEKDFDLADALQ